MKRLSSILCLLLTLSVSASSASKEPKLDANKQKEVIEKVKEYCTLMQEFSGDVEKIENMETIFAMCENSNVSVFNDLAASSTKDISANSMPLQQYMMVLTDKFENSVKTNYSGFKYIKLVVQPSPLKEFDAASYAFVKVDKQVNAGSMKSKQHLNIIVNTATLKISSTISEDYEDPQRIYLEALEKFNEGKYKTAIPLFEKVSGLPRFPGRYRAKTMLGWIYAEQKDYPKANELLRESSADDPLGGIILASKVLLADDAPVNLTNYTEAGLLLQTYGNVKDKEIPTMHLIAKSAIVDAANLQTMTFKIDAVNVQLGDELISDPATTDAFRLRGYFVKSFLNSVSKDKNKLQTAFEDLKKAEELLRTVNFDQKDYERWDAQLTAIRMFILVSQGELAEVQKLRETIINEKPHAAAWLAATYITAKNYETALELYRKAADYGDAFSTYVISLSYLPLHKPRLDYEKAFVGETQKVRDDNLVHNWKYFAQFLFSEKSQSNKSYEEFLKWNQKAIELGDVNAMEDYAFFEAAGVQPFAERNIPHSLELACKAASIGLRSKSSKLFNIHGFTKVYEMADLKIPFEETQTTKTLKALDEQGNGAASFLLYSDYLDLVKNDEQAKKYLIRSADANFFYGMYQYVTILLFNNYYEEAEKLIRKMLVYPYSYVHNMMGDIEKDYRKNYQLAKAWYELGIKNDKNPVCSDRMGDLYKDGLGVKKNYKMAKMYYSQAIRYYKAFDYEEDNEVIKDIKKKISDIDRQVAGQAYAGTVKEMIAQLNNVLDSSISEEERITLSQTVLSEIFATPQAKVKTMDATGKTVVSTETAEDFMLRLSTMKTDKRVVGIGYKKTTDEKFKLTELTIKMK